MPVYEYEHIEEPCHRGKMFDVTQSIHDKALSKCPDCAGAVRKLISRTSISTPKSNRELRDLGFTKLVKRDDGVYENVRQTRKRPEFIKDYPRLTCVHP